MKLEYVMSPEERAKWTVLTKLKNRAARMKRLLAMNAPAVIADREIILIRMAFTEWSEPQQELVAAAERARGVLQACEEQMQEWAGEGTGPSQGDMAAISAVNDLAILGLTATLATANKSIEDYDAGLSLGDIDNGC